MNSTLKFAFGASALALAAQAAAQVTFYEGEGFRGRTFAASRQVDNFRSAGFNDRASSVIVDHGRWEVCEDAQFTGRCAILRRGNYESLTAMGMNDRISSMRPVGNRAQYDNEAPQPVAAAPYEYRRRPNERMFEAPVTSVHAVVGSPEQRCWIEHQQVPESNRGGANVGAGIAGAVIGGILGHQVGGGTGKDLATIGGAVAGGAIGANAGRGNSNTTMVDREVRRCDSVASTQPAYWDVTYNYRGVEHHMQMSSAPGATIPVNRDGEPRG
jgi:uncharacterized protein YcfJ